MTDDIWAQVARNIVKATPFKVDLTETVIELVKTVINEDQAKFLTNFSKATMSIEELSEITGLKEDALIKIMAPLINTGLIMALPSKSSEKIIYRLLPLFPGIFEFQFMRGETGEKQKKLSKIFDKIFDEMVPAAQDKYERTLKSYKKLPAFDRVVPVEELIEINVEKILPVEEVKTLIKKHDLIGISTCYCRHEKLLLESPCKLNAPSETCMFFGRIAEFFINYGFARSITKDKALEILSQAEDIGLVHKTFHDRLNPDLDEIAICSCCKCCCQIFGLHYLGVIPLHSITSYISKLNPEKCVVCGTCVKLCPTEALKLVDTIINLTEEKCIGCGLCAHHCPEKAIKLERTGPRDVFIPTPKISKDSK